MKPQNHSPIRNATVPRQSVRGRIAKILLAVSFGVAAAFLPGVAGAHCDTLDGPVVAAARTALETGNLNGVLAWVQPADEAQIRQAFQQARGVRTLNAEAKDLADRYFFETLVRVHRAGEGAPYTGLKPAGTDLGPAIPAADEAIRSGSLERVERLVDDAVHAGLSERFAALKGAPLPGGDVNAGRAWVEAYVPFLHYVEGLYVSALGEVGGEQAEAQPAQVGECGAHPGPAEPKHAEQARPRPSHAEPKHGQPSGR